MFKNNVLKIFIGLISAGLVWTMALSLVQAQSNEGEADQGDCAGCHEITQDHWAESGHGNAYDNPEFQKAWRDQNSPQECLSCHTTGFDLASGAYDSENVACATCHSPSPDDHPNDIMPTDISSRLCGTCHVETHGDWEKSGHAQEDLACVRCHNAHTTDLKAPAVQELCQSCHNETTHYYSGTAHSQAGLLCSDCHLRVSDSQMGDGHASRTHTFEVDLQTCASCHEDDMHTAMPAADPAIDDTGGEPQPILSLAGAPILQTDPDPVGPMGFAVLATLVGMGFGIVAAPWLSRHNRRSNDKKKDE